MNHNDWRAELKRACAPQVELPTPKHMRVSGQRGAVEIHLSGRAVCENMQHDWAAFEGWSLALLTWGDAGHITLGWEEPEKGTVDPHYQRFLYRVAKFSSCFKSEFKVRDPERLETLRVGQGPGRFVLNAARGNDTATPAQGSEAALEKAIATDGHALNVLLKDRFGLHAVDRQLPVGVFHDKVHSHNAIFPRAKSAIDLVAIDKDDTFWLIELKLKDNRKVGAVSELFFYAMVMQDLQQGRLHCDATLGRRAVVKPAHVIAARRLRAVLLMEGGGPTPAVHPLVHDKVLELLSKRVGTIDFQAATLP